MANNQSGKNMGDDSPITRRDLVNFRNDLTNLFKSLRSSINEITSVTSDFIEAVRTEQELLRQQNVLLSQYSDLLRQSQQREKARYEREQRIVRIRIVEEPLTSQNLSTILLTLTELHTKCWLIEQGRIGDLLDFPETRGTSFEDEANLRVVRLTHNSPTVLDLLLASGSIVGAIKIAIDTVAQIHLRYKSVKLDNQKKALEIRQKEQEGWQNLQRAELEMRKVQIEIMEQELELEQKWLELEEKHLQLRSDVVATRMIDRLSYPHNIRQTADKTRLASSLAPHLLDLQKNSVGLERIVQEIDDDGGR